MSEVLANEVNISIHAPAKGATGLFHLRLQSLQNFNPRSREGSDKKQAQPQNQADNFNPRSREGSDSAKLHRLWLKLINTKELLFPKIQFCH